MNGHAAAYSNFRRIEGSVTVSPAKFACQTSDMTGVAFCARTTASAVPRAQLDESLLNPFRVMFLKHCPQLIRRAVRPRMDVLNQRTNIRGHHEQASNQPACLDSSTCAARLAAQKRQSPSRPPLDPSPPEHTTYPREHTRTHHCCDGGAGERSIAAAQAVRPRPSTRRPRNLHPRPPPHFPQARVQRWENSRSNSIFRSSLSAPTAPLPAPTSPASSGKSSPPPADQPRRSTPL